MQYVANIWTVIVFLFWGSLVFAVRKTTRAENRKFNKQTEALKKIAAITYCGFCEDHYLESNTHSPLCPITVAREAIK